ncbi:MAG: thioesterase family protein [Bowdeniella nasicola]|nr:thioesterase family protein [Bowdeniella nasicola]
MGRQSYYRSLGNGYFESTALAEGAWDITAQHMAAACGLLTRELERYSAASDADQPAGAPKRFARLCFEILGKIHAGRFRITVETLRAGRTIELLRATMIHGEQAVLSVRAWRLMTSDATPIAGIEDPPIPPPDQCEPYPEMRKWPGGYMRATTYRRAPGARPGCGVVWMTTDVDVLAGEKPSSLAKALSMADTTNGVMPRGDKDQWMFPNVDFTVHLYRLPQGEWIGFDVRQSVGADGIGVTSTVLHDLDGPFGRAEQILTVRDMRS